MAKRLLSINLIAFILLFILCSKAQAQNKSTYKSHPIINITGDESPNPTSKKFTGDINAVMNMKPYTTTFSDSLVNITDVFTGLTTLHDYVSNAVPQHIVMQGDDSIHLVLMRNMTPGNPVSDRRVSYTVSTDRGVSWTIIDTSIWNYSSGYPYLDVFTTGEAVIGMHTITPGFSAHSVVCIDIVPMIGVFQICDPGLMPDSGVGVWMRIVTTPSGIIPCIASINSNVSPNTYTNILNSTNNCTFSGWLPRSDINNAERYAIARASNGKIGIAYIRNDINIANTGDIRLIESIDNGVTWSSPITVYDAQPNSSNFLGGRNGIDLIYAGNTPKVVFDLVWQNDQGLGFPNMCSKIMFWSPDVNGGNPVAVADSTNTQWFGAEGPNDGFTPICRGSIGKSRGNIVLYCTYNVSRFETWPPIGGNHYFDVYLAWSIDGGATWFGREKVTNISGPLRDCRFPNLSPINDPVTTYWSYANIEYLSDSVPGFAIFGANESPAQQHFLRVRVSLFGGVNNHGGELPLRYELWQNYPNPFNPITTIKYQLPKPAYVKLTVYNALGKEIKVLVNKYIRSANNEVTFNGECLSSGVYFYRQEVYDGNKIVYSQSKKMVLLK